MSDRELLELAAKAAGLNVAGWDEKPFDPEYCHNGVPAVRLAGVPCWWWNPLVDDGDAFRLQVVCFMKVKVQKFGTPWVEVAASISFDPTRRPRTTTFKRILTLGDDANAAVRRTITTVGADIARAMP